MGLGDGELSTVGGVAACSPSEGVVADEDTDGGSLARSRNAAGEGVPVDSGGHEWCFRKGCFCKGSLGDVAGVGVRESL